MAFNPQSITPSTLKSLVDNLASHLKTNPLPKTPKRSQVQEALAAALGWPSWHGAITAAKARESRAPVVPSDPWKLPVPGFLGHENPDAAILVRMANSRLEGQAGIWRVPAPDMARHALIRGSEHARRALIEQVARLNPDRPILIIHGPGSLPLRRWDGQDVRPVPFPAALAHASAGELSDALVSAMPNNPDSSMWHARAVSLVAALLHALVSWHRPALDMEQLRAHLVLDNIKALAARKDIPPHAIQPLKAYLQSLPGYQAQASRQTQATLEQHDYLTMQIQPALDKAAAGQVWVLVLDSMTKSPRLRMEHAATWNNNAALEVLEQWPVANPGGLIILDGLYGHDEVWRGLPARLPLWRDAGVGAWLGVVIDDDMPDEPLRARIRARVASDLRVFE